MAEISISSGCDRLSANGCDRLSANGCDRLSANGCDRHFATGCDQLFNFHAMPLTNRWYPPPGLQRGSTPAFTKDTSASHLFALSPHSHATAQSWSSQNQATPPPFPVNGSERSGAEWPEPAVTSQMFEGVSDLRLGTAPSHGAMDIPLPFSDYFVQNSSKFGPINTTPPQPQFPPQTNFSDLLRFTVTVSSSGQPHPNNTPDLTQICHDAIRNEDLSSENFATPSAASRTPWNYSSPNLYAVGGKMSSDHQTAQYNVADTVYGNDFNYSSDALPLVQSFRAIESAIAANDKRALKKAVNRLATVMVNKETTSESSEAGSTGSETVKDWSDRLRVSSSSTQANCANLARLLAAFQHNSTAGPANSNIDVYSKHLPAEEDSSLGGDLASLILHANQRHQIGPSDEYVLNTPSTETPLEAATARTNIKLDPEDFHRSFTAETMASSHKDTDTPTPKARGDEDHIPLDLCKGNVLTLSLKDQSTCRSLQKHLKEASPKVRAAILQEALPHFVRLMTDPIGNYFCQTVLQVCSQDDLRRILDRVWKQLPAMSKSLYGTRAVQKLIERCCPSESKRLLKAFAGHFHDLAIDACGSHVIRQILESVPAEHTELVHAEIRANVLEIAMTKRGCCAVQKSLDRATEQQRMLLIDKILEHIPQLIQDPFGNYVIQHVLNMEDASINSRILEYVLIDLWYLSKHKFASNVVERCVRLSNPYQLGSIMGSLVSLGVRKVRELLEDSFGNYVIQSVLETVPHDTYGPLDRVVAFCLPDLNQTAHGRRITQILLAKFPFLADTPKLYREGKTRLSNDNPTDSSTGPTSDNSMEPRSSTGNSRERSSSSSRSKAHKEKSISNTSSGGDTSTMKPKSDDPLHGSQTDNSGLNLTDNSSPATRKNIGLTADVSDAGQHQTGNTRQQRPSPHSLSVAINRFRNSRRHQGSLAEGLTNPSGTLSPDAGCATTSVTSSPPSAGDAWALSGPSVSKNRGYEPSRGKVGAASIGHSPQSSRCDLQSPNAEHVPRLRNREE